MLKLFSTKAVARAESSMTLQEQKSALRKRVQSKLKTVDSWEIQKQSGMVTQKVLGMKAYQDAKSISIFLSMPDKEISTRQIVLQALEDRKSVFVPYIHKDDVSQSRILSMLQLRNKRDFETLKPDRWGIPSIPENSINDRMNALGGFGISKEMGNSDRKDNRLDLIFLPAVAFDHLRQRLGHGKGFYDRYLETYRSTLESNESMPPLVGLALEQQLLPAEEIIPTSEHDWRVDFVVSAVTE